jgi:hypothetical protein
MPGAGEATYVGAGLGDDHFGDVSSNAWDGVQPGDVS